MTQSLAWTQLILYLFNQIINFVSFFFLPEHNLSSHPHRKTPTRPEAFEETEQANRHPRRSQRSCRIHHHSGVVSTSKATLVQLQTRRQDRRHFRHFHVHWDHRGDFIHELLVCNPCYLSKYVIRATRNMRQTKG